MNPLVRDYLLQKQEERKRLEAELAPSTLQNVGSMLAAAGAGFMGRDPLQAGMALQGQQQQRAQKALSDFDQASNMELKGMEMDRAIGLENEKIGREKELFEFDKTQRNSKTDPMSEESKMAQDLARKMGYQGDVSKLTAAQFERVSPVLSKMFDAQQSKVLKSMANKSDTTTGEKLPIDKKKIVENLATKNANKIAIANQIDSVLSIWDTLDDEQKLAQGRQMLKTLNSPEGADAIGAEEANRLGSKLEFAMGNFTNSNSTQFGRDLEGFKEQAFNTSKGLKGAIQLNQGIIDREIGRDSTPSQSSDMIKIIDPKGIPRMIPANKLEAALKAGGKRA
jgi:hypothetical protein